MAFSNGIFRIVINYVDIKFSTVLYGFIFHFIISLIVIPLDFIFNWDFMLYLNLGGVPIFEDIASKLTAQNLQFFNPILMLVLYFIAFSIIICVAKILSIIFGKKKETI